ncbi:MAG: DUF6531 domain-containing protein, partial [Telluria sp.]
MFNRKELPVSAPQSLQYLRTEIAVLFAFFLLLMTGNANAVTTVHDGRSYSTIERYKTEAQARNACVSFAAKYTNPTGHCSTIFRDEYTKVLAFSTGWHLVDTGRYGFPDAFLGTFYFCAAGTFYIDGMCVTFIKIPADDVPHSTGPSCSGPAPEPSCGQPINPGTGNMWHIESDYAPAGTADLSVVRTYNSSPNFWDATWVHGFGARWTNRYDSLLRAEAAFPPNTATGSCWVRSDSQYQVCGGNALPFENDVPPDSVMPSPGSRLPSDSIPDAISITRGGGQRIMFNRDGLKWVANNDIRDRMTAVYNTGGTAVTEWVYNDAQSKGTERFDA